MAGAADAADLPAELRHRYVRIAVTATLGEDVSRYAVAAIVAELDALHPDYGEIPEETFWEVVGKHHRTGGDQR